MNNNFFDFNFDINKNDNKNDNKKIINIESNESNIYKYIKKYKNEIYIIIFFILMYIVSNTIFDYNYPKLNDNIFLSKIIDSFRIFLKKYQRIWLFILIFCILLIDYFNKININILTKYFVIFILFLIILLFPFLPFSTYYNLYINIIHKGIKTVDNLIIRK